MRRVRRAYTSPGNPVAFSTPARVADALGITHRQAKIALEHLEGYTMHREYKRPRFYNPYYVHNRREQVQADLIDVSKLARSNGGVRFLLLLIDIMTKKVWVYPMKNKTSAESKRKLTQWLNEIDVPPEKLKTDRGNEFVNRPVQELLRSRGVEWQPAIGTMKAAIAERANKTLQILMYKYLTENETFRYIDKLPGLVATYNLRKHRTIGMPPAEADRPGNEGRLQGVFHTKYAAAARRRRDKLPFKVGDLVRIKTDPKKLSAASRAYAPQFKDEYFEIYRINRTLPVAMYHLKSHDTGERIKGGFYAAELQRQRGDVFKVERVLRRARINGRDMIFVKWRHYGNRWNSWIPAGNVVRRFRRRR